MVLLKIIRGCMVMLKFRASIKKVIFIFGHNKPEARKVVFEASTDLSRKNMAQILGIYLSSFENDNSRDNRPETIRENDANKIRIIFTDHTCEFFVAHSEFQMVILNALFRFMSTDIDLWNSNGVEQKKAATG
jgi:hypothetical protein